MIYLVLIPATFLAAIVCVLGVTRKIPVEWAMGLYGGACFVVGYLINIKL